MVSDELAGDDGRLADDVPLRLDPRAAVPPSESEGSMIDGLEVGRRQLFERVGLAVAERGAETPIELDVVSRAAARAPVFRGIPAG